jgi:hypothetical protein
MQPRSVEFKTHLDTSSMQIDSKVKRTITIKITDQKYTVVDSDNRDVGFCYTTKVIAENKEVDLHTLSKPLEVDPNINYELNIEDSHSGESKVVRLNTAMSRNLFRYITGGRREEGNCKDFMNAMHFGCGRARLNTVYLRECRAIKDDKDLEVGHTMVIGTHTAKGFDFKHFAIKLTEKLYISTLGPGAPHITTSEQMQLFYKANDLVKITPELPLGSSFDPNRIKEANAKNYSNAPGGQSLCSFAEELKKVEEAKRYAYFEARFNDLEKSGVDRSAVAQFPGLVRIMELMPNSAERAETLKHFYWTVYVALDDSRYNSRYNSFYTSSTRSSFEECKRLLTTEDLLSVVYCFFAELLLEDGCLFAYKAPYYLRLIPENDLIDFAMGLQQHCKLAPSEVMPYLPESLRPDFEVSGHLVQFMQNNSESTHVAVAICESTLANETKQKILSKYLRTVLTKEQAFIRMRDMRVIRFISVSDRNAIIEDVYDMIRAQYEKYHARPDSTLLFSCLDFLSNYGVLRSIDEIAIHFNAIILTLPEAVKQVAMSEYERRSVSYNRQINANNARREPQYSSAQLINSHRQVLMQANQPDQAMTVAMPTCRNNR